MQQNTLAGRVDLTQNQKKVATMATHKTIPTAMTATAWKHTQPPWQ